jgi:hypothetical protein
MVMAVTVVGITAVTAMRMPGQVDVGTVTMVRLLGMSSAWHDGSAQHQVHQHDQRDGESHGMGKESRRPSAAVGGRQEDIQDHPSDCVDWMVNGTSNRIS